ncbi:hypothetical protein P9D34_17480 [Bacillus swezeyi]|nr:hypothetical protein [Bacillus swezeyi]MEC1262173.1 hypothetical protein [Bacillus swezeyi]MED2927259.1 hypothetical protein [Bacillus swezeyi]MED2962457.1 hypothetical protein [Bacillus swezeyi]MED3072088.1 hypothetical protein [Bacillus swezeyi]MED3082628.1 hypothetical protein [Bacillus swezeyi]
MIMDGDQDDVVPYIYRALQNKGHDAVMYQTADTGHIGFTQAHTLEVA